MEQGFTRLAFGLSLSRLRRKSQRLQRQWVLLLRKSLPHNLIIQRMVGQDPADNLARSWFAQVPINSGRTIAFRHPEWPLPQEA